MPLDPENYKKVLDKSHFQKMRGMADPAADTLINEVLKKEGVGRVKAIFDSLIKNIHLPLTDLPEEVVQFIKKNEQLPDWADNEKIALAHELFRDHGPKFLIFLYFKSLPIMYSCANGAQVLIQTGRLAHDSQTLETFGRRIAETGQFLIDVMTSGGMQKGGIGIEAALRVRLIHAAIRSFISMGDWEQDILSQPINQSDMATTLMTFSVAILDGLDTINVDESNDRKDAYFHLWNVVGYIMGIHPDLLPPSLEAGRQYLAFALQEESKVSEAGITLTKALTNFVDTNLEIKLLKDLPEAMIKMLTGTEIASKVGIQNQGYLGIILPAFFSKIFGLGEKLEDKFPQIRAIFDDLSFELSKRMVNYFNKEKNIGFRIPKSLKNDWGLDKTTIGS